MAETKVAPIEAFFATREEAESARNALRMRYQVSQPEPVSPPVDGRSWRLDITPTSTGSLSPLYSNPQVVDRIVGIVLRFNGITTQVDRNAEK